MTWCRYLCACGCAQHCECGVTDLPPALHGRQLAPSHPAPGVVTCDLAGCDLALGHFCKHQHKGGNDG